MAGNAHRSGSTLGLAAAVVAVGLALRVVGLDWGLPNEDHFFSYHPDEIFLLLPSVGFAAGDWNPHFFNYGTLYLYLVGLPAVVLGLTPDPGVLPAGLRPLHLEGRIITAALAMGTVAALYLALRRESPRAAALAAALLAMCPVHVVNSHYATVDVPATFFLVVSLLLALRVAPRPAFRNALLAGGAVGLAAATKYNGGLFIIPVLLVPLLSGRGRGPASWWVGVAAGAVVAFLVTCPFVGSAEFWGDFLFEVRHMRIGGTLAFDGTGSGWGYHLVRGLPVALGFPLAAAALLGVLAAPRLSSPAGRASLVWLIVYLGVVGAARERFIRYLVPLTPFLCVLAAFGIMWAVESARALWARLGAIVFAAAVVLLTMLYAFGQMVPFVWQDPRDRAWRDLAPVVGEQRVGLVHTPWYYHPPVSPYNAGAFSRPMFAEWNEAAGRPVIVTGWDARALERAEPGLFCLSDLEARDPIRLGDPSAVDLVTALDAHYGERREYREPPTPFSWLAPGRGWAPPDWLYPTPRIFVYSEAVQ